MTARAGRVRARLRHLRERVAAALEAAWGPGVVAPPPPPEPPRPACAGLWDTPMVQVNGDLTTCCLDEGLENKLGNVRDTPLAELWSGATLHRWRVAQAEGRFADSGPLCTRCNWRSAGAMDAARLEKYLSATGEEVARAAARARHR